MCILLYKYLFQTKYVCSLSGIHLWAVPESTVVFSCGLLISGLNWEYLHNAYVFCSKKHVIYICTGFCKYFLKTFFFSVLVVIKIVLILLHLTVFFHGLVYNASGAYLNKIYSIPFRTVESVFIIMLCFSFILFLLLYVCCLEWLLLM